MLAVIEPPYIHKRNAVEYIIYLVRQGEMFLFGGWCTVSFNRGFLILDPDKYMWGKEQHIVNTIIFISIRNP